MGPANLSGLDRQTPLDRAKNGKLEVVKLLLKKVDVDAKSQDGQTPLLNSA